MIINEEEKNCSTQLHFVLVHGSGHGAWCWYKIKTLMENIGYKVTALNVTSAGIDRTDANTVRTFDEYNRPLLDFLTNLPENEKVILVGHSAGGLSVTDCIHKFGTKKIHMAIYFAANMLKNGFVAQQDAALKLPENCTEYYYALGDDQPPTSSMLKKELRRELLYNMTPMEDYVLACMLLRPTPARPFPCWLAEGAESDLVPRVYIKTTHDEVMRAEVEQEAMIRRWPPCQVFEVESDHSAFFSNPFGLFGFIVQAVSSVGF